jgi:hypothetical protein
MLLSQQMCHMLPGMGVEISPKEESVKDGNNDKKIVSFKRNLFIVKFEYE